MNDSIKNFEFTASTFHPELTSDERVHRLVFSDVIPEPAVEAATKGETAR